VCWPCYCAVECAVECPSNQLRWYTVRVSRPEPPISSPGGHCQSLKASSVVQLSVGPVECVGPVIVQLSAPLISSAGTLSGLQGRSPPSPAQVVTVRVSRPQVLCSVGPIECVGPVIVQLSVQLQRHNLEEKFCQPRQAGAIFVGKICQSGAWPS
jgi:hypothetical protein